MASYKKPQHAALHNVTLRAWRSWNTMCFLSLVGTRPLEKETIQLRGVISQLKENLIWSRNIVVGVKRTLQARRSGTLRLFSFPIGPDRLWGPTQPHIQWVPALFPRGLKRLERGLNPSLASSAAVKIEMMYFILSL
jgi:hypothetical protein